MGRAGRRQWSASSTLLLNACVDLARWHDLPPPPASLRIKVSSCCAVVTRRAPKREHAYVDGLACDTPDLLRQLHIQRQLHPAWHAAESVSMDKHGRGVQPRRPLNEEGLLRARREGPGGAPQLRLADGWDTACTRGQSVS